MKTRHLLLTAALLGAAGLFLSGERTSNGAAPALSREPALRARGRAVATPKPPAAARILLLQERALLIGDEAAGTTALAGANLFRSQSWAPPPAPAIAVQAAPPPPPPPPPQAPPLPFRYLGKKFEDGKWELYLAQGETTLIVREHQPIDASYLAGAIDGGRFTITYVPLNQAQTLTIGGNDE